MQVSIKYAPQFVDRLITLRKFRSLMKEFSRSKAARGHAYYLYKQVLRQVNDRKLMEMRRRFILAVRARNERAEWKIGNQIKAYLGEQLLVNPNWHR